MIDLYTAPTPNGWKVSVTLEELEIPYEAHFVDLGAGEQRSESFLKINPNGRIPVIFDRDAGVRVFESGAAMIYLAEMSGSKLLPSDGHQRAEVLSWLMFQMGGVGPMMGQANVFFRYFPEKIPAVIERYQNESRRLFEVVDRGLRESATGWLARDLSLADIANWCWIRIHQWSGVSTDGLEALNDWKDRMESRPACKRGVEIPSSPVVPDEDRSETLVAEARKMLTR